MFVTQAEDNEDARQFLVVFSGSGGSSMGKKQTFCFIQTQSGWDLFH